MRFSRLVTVGAVAVAALLITLTSPSTFVAAALKVEAVSCSGWKLNHLPEVAKFLKEAGNADSYGDELKIRWENGHSPTFVFFNAKGVEENRVDISDYSSDQLHSMLHDYGLRQITEADVWDDATRNL
jgi:hypothetical protein